MPFLILTHCAAPGEKGAEEHYDLSDALGKTISKYTYFAMLLTCKWTAVASWLNVFVRKADVVKIACIAQYVSFRLNILGFWSLLTVVDRSMSSLPLLLRQLDSSGRPPSSLCTSSQIWCVAHRWTCTSPRLPMTERQYQSLYAIWMPTSPKRRKAPNLSTLVLFCRMMEQRFSSLSLTVVQMKNLPFRSYLGPWILMWGSGMRWRYTKCGIKIYGPRMDSKKAKMSRLLPGQKLGRAVMCWRNTLSKVSEISSISCYTVNTDNYPSFSYCIQIILR